MPQGVVIEVRRGGHDVLAKLSSDMSRLGISGYIRIERIPKDQTPRVSQVIIHESQPKLAIHETESLIGGLEALLEIERDSAALDALISLVELSNEEILRIINLYPEGLLSSDENQTDESSDDWWNNVKLNTSSWRREAKKLPEGWNIESDGNGNQYYYNSTTGESTCKLLLRTFYYFKSYAYNAFSTEINSNHNLFYNYFIFRGISIAGSYY